MSVCVSFLALRFVAFVLLVYLLPNKCISLGGVEPLDVFLDLHNKMRRPLEIVTQVRKNWINRSRELMNEENILFNATRIIETISHD